MTIKLRLAMFATAALLALTTIHVDRAFATPPLDAHGRSFERIKKPTHSRVRHGKKQVAAKPAAEPNLLALLFKPHAPAPQASRVAPEQTYGYAPAAGSASFIGGGDLVSTARSYLGTNPTGRSRLWCGAFMDLILRKTGRKGGGNYALGYADYGARTSRHVGAIAVMRRKGGGHVGVVSGDCVTREGQQGVMVISGNHNRTVAEACYAKARIVAYVSP